MLSLSILLPVLHTHAAQPSHCRLADRQNSEGQKVNNETLVRKKAGPGPSVMLSSTRCSVRCLFIVVLVGLLRLFCQIAYDGSSPVCTATTLSHCRPNTARYTVAKQYTVDNDVETFSSDVSDRSFFGLRHLMKSGHFLPVSLGQKCPCYF